MSNVIIYSTSICPYCVRAKQFLTNKNIQFEEILVDKNPDKMAEMLEKSGGQRTVPQIFINDVHVGGSDDLYALDQQGELDKLLTQE